MIKLSEAIKRILFQEKDSIIISSDGYISREVFSQRTEGVFPMTGSMGLAPAIGLGIALNTDKRIVIINGDGAFLMSAGTQSLIEHYDLPNLLHIVLINGTYGSTGNQKCINLPQGEYEEIIIDPYNEKPSARIINLEKIKDEIKTQLFKHSNIK